MQNNQLVAPVLEQMPLKTRARVLVVEDHPFFREQLVHFINRQPELQCVGEATDLQQIIPAVETHQPELITLDLRLGNADSLRTVASLRAKFPQLYIVVLSQYDISRFTNWLVDAGADGFVMKSQATRELVGVMSNLLSSKRRAA